MAYRFDVYTKSEPSGEGVGAEEVTITNSGALVFSSNGHVTVAYAAHEWVRMEYAGEEE